MMSFDVQRHKGLTKRWSEPLTARKFTFDDFNTEPRSWARSRQRWLSSVSLGLMQTSLRLSFIIVLLTTLNAPARDWEWPSESGWPVNAENLRLMKDRFAEASRVRLGTPEDVLAIQRVVLAAMKDPAAQVIEIRWLSADVAMVNTLLIEAGRWIFVVEKRQDQWTIRLRYLTGIF
jgi:hypothetical protein